MEQKRDERFSKENLRRLVEGRLHWEEVKKVIRLDPKDSDRFWKYLIKTLLAYRSVRQALQGPFHNRHRIYTQSFSA